MADKQHRTAEKDRHGQTPGHNRVLVDTKTTNKGATLHQTPAHNRVLVDTQTTNKGATLHQVYELHAELTDQVSQHTPV